MSFPNVFSLGSIYANVSTIDIQFMNRSVSMICISVRVCVQNTKRRVGTQVRKLLCKFFSGSYGKSVDILEQISTWNAKNLIEITQLYN